MGYWSIGKIPLDREAIKCMSSLFKPTFQYSTIPWPRPGFHGLSSVSLSCEVLQRQYSIPANSRQGGPLFHLD